MIRKKIITLAYVLVTAISCTVVANRTAVKADVVIAKVSTVDSGICGKNLTWILDSEGTLTISGEGEMYGYEWNVIEDENRNNGIKKVVIENGVTSIGSFAFAGSTSLESVELPTTLTIIGEYAFNCCENLKYVNLPLGLQKIESGAFCGCDSLPSIEIPKRVKYIGNWTFMYCTNLKNIVFIGDAPFIGPEAFDYVTANILYPSNNLTWTKEIIENEEYGGNLTWISNGAYSAKTLSLSQLRYTYDGNAKTPEVTVKNSLGEVIDESNYTVTYKDNVNVGTATVEVTMNEDSNYTGTLTETFEIEKISMNQVTISESTYTYDGTEKKPTVTVKDVTGKEIDESNYTVIFKDNINAGTAIVEVVANGDSNYTGTLTKNFIINKASNMIVAKASYSKIALSKTQSFILNVKAAGGKLSYKSNSRSVTVNSTGKVTIAKSFIGKATITITASDANHKTVTKAVTVNVKPGTVKLVSVNNTSRKKMTVKWIKLSNVSGYQIQYSTNSKFKGVKTITVNSSSATSKVLSGVTKGKTYYVRVNAFKKMGNEKLFGDYSVKKILKITK